MNDLSIDLSRLRTSCANCSLQALCLPANVSETDIAQIDDLVKTRRSLKRGEFLHRAGQALSVLYVAREGAFKTTIMDEQGFNQVVGFQLPGELIGLDALGSGKHACEAVALTQANVCEVPLDQLEHIAAKVPGLQRQLLRIIGHSIRGNYSHLETLNRRSAVDRLALFLHSLSERYHALGRPSDMFLLPMSREEIGSYLGLAIETVSRTLTKLQDDAVIEVNGRNIRILKMDVLNTLAHAAHEPN